MNVFEEAELRIAQREHERDARVYEALADRTRERRDGLRLWSLKRRWRLGGIIAYYEAEAFVAREAAEDARLARLGY